MTRTRKLVGTILLVGLIASVAGGTTFAAFTSSTSNGGNTFAAGTVYVRDDDSAGVMWNVTNQTPASASVVKCIRVTYDGSLDADVKLYASNATAAVDQYINVTIEKGTMPGSTTFPACTSFSSESTIFSGTLDGFKTAKTSFATGIAAYPGAATKWVTGDSVVYRFTVSLANNYAAQGLTSSGGFTWEARNQ